MPIELVTFFKADAERKGDICGLIQSLSLGVEAGMGPISIAEVEPGERLGEQNEKLK